MADLPGHYNRFLSGKGGPAALFYRRLYYKIISLLVNVIMYWLIIAIQRQKIRLTIAIRMSFLYRIMLKGCLKRMNEENRALASLMTY